ncbi:hypothetical protein Lalb_Chr05g0221991 [Lupinus albus]|uniref:Uncharacterized protein n=1 Tax=Lupinus albus TaxID=3870 RepID=A0A6A4QK63_LUPAL|nr:hypothetical protein Lalb_Chr05g0221991 [Lupinus albus]
MKMLKATSLIYHDTLEHEVTRQQICSGFNSLSQIVPISYTISWHGVFSIQYL